MYAFPCGMKDCPYSDREIKCSPKVEDLACPKDGEHCCPAFVVLAKENGDEV